MYKERSVPIDYGDSPGGRYYLFSGEQNYTLPYLHNEAWCRNKYDSVLGSSYRGSLGFSGMEKIEYDRGGHTRFNNCNHVCSKEMSRTFFFAWMTSPPAGYSRLAWYQRYIAPLTSVTLYDNHHLTDDVMLARNRAWWNMQPRFEGEVDMLNFLFEMKDFKVCAKHLFRPDMSDLRQMMRKRRFPKVNDPTLPVAEATLLWNFALRPLMRDLTEIIAQAQLCALDAQTQFQGRGLEYQKSHYSEELAREEVLSTPNAKYWYWRNGKVHKTKFTATMEYKYRYTPRDAYATFIRFWGLNPDFEAIWNGLPFSFVFDYMCAIGKSIHAMETDKNVTLSYRQYCESLVTTLDSGVFIVPDPRIGGLIVGGQWIDTPQDYILVNGLSSKIYHRYNATPSRGPALPKLRQPSGTQIANLVALARCLF